jgi:hypothetical protein
MSVSLPLARTQGRRAEVKREFGVPSPSCDMEPGAQENASTTSSLPQGCRGVGWGRGGWAAEAGKQGASSAQRGGGGRGGGWGVGATRGCGEGTTHSAKGKQGCKGGEARTLHALPRLWMPGACLGGGEGVHCVPTSVKNDDKDSASESGVHRFSNGIQ